MSQDESQGPAEGPVGAGPQGDLRPPGVLVGHVFGTPVYLSPTWLATPVMITWLLADDFTPDPSTSPTGRAYVLSGGIAVLLAFSVFLHEASHALVARLLGLRVRRIVLHLVGGYSDVDHQPDTPGRDYLIAVAGPITSLLIAAIGLATRPVLHGDADRYVLILAVANGTLAVLNLLPGLPMDGGRLVRAAIWRATRDQDRASATAAWAGRLLAIGLIVGPLGYGLLVAPADHRGQHADLFALWGLLAAMFLWGGATMELRAAQAARQLARVTPRSLVRPALPVPRELPLAEAVRRARAAGAEALVAVDQDGRPSGLVPEASVLAVPEPRRPWVAVSTVARPIEPGMVLRLDERSDRLIDRLRAHPAGEYLVVEPDGAVLGVLTARDVAAVLTAGPGRGSDERVVRGGRRD